MKTTNSIKKKALAFIIGICGVLGMVTTANAESDIPFKIKLISVIPIENTKGIGVYLDIWFENYETITENFKLVFTQPTGSYRSEHLIENKWLSGVRINPLFSDLKNSNYTFNVQAITTNTTSELYSFSFNYNFIPPPWRQAGCDNLTELNTEWRNIYGSDSDYQSLADMKVSFQNHYGNVENATGNLGCDNKLGWKLARINVKQFVWQYTLCADGWRSGSTGRGTCSWHGGINSYRGYYKTISAKRIQFYWEN